MRFRSVLVDIWQNRLNVVLKILKLDKSHDLSIGTWVIDVIDESAYELGVVFDDLFVSKG